MLSEPLIRRDQQPSLSLGHIPKLVIRYTLVHSATNIQHIVPHLTQRLHSHPRDIFVYQDIHATTAIP